MTNEIGIIGKNRYEGIDPDEVTRKTNLKYANAPAEPEQEGKTDVKLEDKLEEESALPNTQQNDKLKFKEKLHEKIVNLAEWAANDEAFMRIAVLSVYSLLTGAIYLIDSLDKDSWNNWAAYPCFASATILASYLISLPIANKILKKERGY